jgi:hypothetical protein
MSSSRPSWRPLLAATSGLFLIILAFLAGQLKAGSDPSIGRGTAASQPEQAPQQTAPRGFGGGQDSSDDDDDNDDDDDDDHDDHDGAGSILDLIFGSSQPDPSESDPESQSSAGAPATHQS